MATTEVPPCLSCGSCCFSLLETYVRVTGDDHERLGDEADHWVTFSGNRAFMRMLDGHCIALRALPVPGAGEPGGTPDTHYVCSVYEQRPQTCRDLERGSAECRAEHYAKRDRPPLLALRSRA